MSQKWQVLLVDDDLFMLNLLSLELTAKGYLVATANSGAQALDLVNANQVGVVITDVFMPDMDGIELVQSLRKCRPGMPVFAMSGGVNHAFSEDFLRFTKGLGADEVFTKPVDVAALIARLEAYSGRDSKRS